MTHLSRPLLVVLLLLLLLLAVAAASVVGVVALRDDRSSTPAPSTITDPTTSPVDLAEADLPLECDDLPVVVDRVVVDDSGERAGQLGVVVAHCDAGAGNPPSAAYVVTARSGRPVVADTLLVPDDQVQVTSVAIRDGEVAMSGSGYSSDDLPRCCPDTVMDAVWRWDGERALRVR